MAKVLNAKSFIMNASTAISAGVREMRRTFNEITDERYSEFSNRSNVYDRFWEYFTNTMWDNLSVWQDYMHEHGLYRHIRPIYNPISRLDSFYQSIYPGVLSNDAMRPPDGTPLAIPLSKDTPDELRQAIGVAWKWSNWQDNKSLYTTYGTITGNVLVRITDDVNSRKVYAEVIWPGHVKDIILDASGNVKEYTIQFETSSTPEEILNTAVVDRTTDRETKTYTEYVSQSTIIRKLDEDVIHQEANPYGFVPAVWWRFYNFGTTYGAPAFFSAIGKIDELNHLMSLVHDEVFKTVGSPILLRGVVKPVNFPTTKRGSTSDLSYRHSDREEKGIIYASNENAGIETLSTNVAEALQVASKLQEEIENDFPELSAFYTLRKMTQTTGPAVDALMADVKPKFTRVAASADQQQIKLWQMVVAIAGMRCRLGSWGNVKSDNIRKAFAPFSLLSYEKGELDFGIDMRPLVFPSAETKYAEEMAFYNAAKAARDAGLPVGRFLHDMGWDDKRIAETLAMYETGIDSKISEEKKKDTQAATKKE